MSKMENQFPPSITVILTNRCLQTPLAMSCGCGTCLGAVGPALWDLYSTSQELGHFPAAFQDTEETEQGSSAEQQPTLHHSLCYTKHRE